MEKTINKQFLYKEETQLPKDLLSKVNPINGYKYYAFWVLEKMKSWKIKYFDNSVFEQHYEDFGQFLESLNIKVKDPENLKLHFKNIHKAALSTYKVLNQSNKRLKQNFTNANIRSNIIENILDRTPKNTFDEIQEIYKDWEKEEFILDSDKTWILNNYLNNADEIQFSKALRTMFEFMSENKAKNDIKSLYIAFKLYNTQKYVDKIDTTSFELLYDKSFNLKTKTDNDYEQFEQILDSFGLIKTPKNKLNPKTNNELIKFYKLKEKTSSKKVKRIVVIGQESAPKDFPIELNNLSGALMEFYKKAINKDKTNYDYLGPYKNEIRFKAMDPAVYAEALTAYHIFNELAVKSSDLFEQNVMFKYSKNKDIDLLAEEIVNSTKWLKTKDKTVKIRTYTVFDNDLMPLMHAGGGVPDLELSIVNNKGKNISAVIETTCYDSGKATQQNEESALGHSIVQMLKSCKNKKDLHKPVVILVNIFDKNKDINNSEYGEVYKRFQDFTSNSFNNNSVESTVFKPIIKTEISNEMKRLKITWKDIQDNWPVINICGFKDLAINFNDYIKDIKSGKFFKDNIRPEKYIKVKQ